MGSVILYSCQCNLMVLVGQSSCSRKHFSYPGGQRLNFTLRSAFVQMHACEGGELMAAMSKKKLSEVLGLNSVVTIALSKNPNNTASIGYSMC